MDPLTEDLAVVASSYEETRTDTEGHRAAESGFFLPRWPSKWPLAVPERSLVCVCASPRRFPTADGQRFIVAYKPGQPNAAIALVENWDAELKKK